MTNGGIVKLHATDNTIVLSNAGGLSVAGAGGKNGGAAVSIGGSLAVNTVANTVQTYISGSTIANADTVHLKSNSSARIWALAISGSVAVGGSSKGPGVGLSGAGAITVNTVANTTESFIGGNSTITTTVGGAVGSAFRPPSIRWPTGSVPILPMQPLTMPVVWI